MDKPINVSGLCYLLLFRLFTEAVEDVQQGVAGHDVGICLRAPLCVDGAGDVRELPENVETV